MAALVILFIVGVALVPLTAVEATRLGWRLPLRGPVAATQQAVSRWGWASVTVVGALGGAAVTLAVGLVVGYLARALERPVDRPVFNWVFHAVSTSRFTKANTTWTLMGNAPVIELVCLVAGIVLACAWGQRWWLPVVCIAAVFLVERYGQHYLAVAINRGHPPITSGTYPSGGVARLISIYGEIILLIQLTIPAIRRSWRIGLWTGLATAAFVEGYTRVYLSKHWLTDVVGGYVYGLLLLLTAIIATTALVTRVRRPAEEAANQRTSRGPLNPSPS